MFSFSKGGFVRKVTRPPGTYVAVRVIGGVAAGTRYACVLAPPSLQELNTHTRPCVSNCGLTTPSVCVVPNPHSRIVDPTTAVSSAKTRKPGGLEAIVMFAARR